jgi:hypothetical protein
VPAAVAAARANHPQKGIVMTVMETSSLRVHPELEAAYAEIGRSVVAAASQQAIGQMPVPNGNAQHTHVDVAVPLRLRLDGGGTGPIETQRLLRCIFNIKTGMPMGPCPKLPPPPPPVDPAR